jgi:hypothetical protein
MLVKINATIYAKVEVFPPDVLNSDTIGDYKAELDCSLQSDALEHLWNMDKPLQEIVINSVEPYDSEGVEEYGNLLNNWESEYKKKKLMLLKM